MPLQKKLFKHKKSSAVQPAESRIFLKTDLLILAALNLLGVTLPLCFTGFSHMFGSKTDWISQHIVLPDYFRTLFYSTGDFFPSLALNLGAGQNIFNFSYYGLYNPVILVSYLLPFVPMANYLEATSILLVCAAVTLLYTWLRRNRIPTGITAFVCLLFLLAGPIYFQAHRQIMFVSYLPFLIGALIATDRYFEKQRSGLLILCTALMILTSYFFAPGCLLTLCLYAALRYFSAQSHPALREVFSAAGKYLLRLFTGILISGLLILPTLHALQNGRTGNTTDFQFDASVIFSPRGLVRAMYNAYGLGFTFLVVIALFYHVYSKRRPRAILSAVLLVLLTFPLYSFLLNGGLYDKPKVLIPLLPLALFLSAHFLCEFVTAEKKRLLLSAASAAVLLLCSVICFGSVKSSVALTESRVFLLTLTDIVLTSMALLLSRKTQKRLFLLVCTGVISASSCLYINRTEQYPQKSHMREISSHTIQEHTKSLQRTTSNLFTLDNANRVFAGNYYQTTLYSSVSSPDYQKVYFDIFNNEISYNNKSVLNATSNPLFNTYIGNRYLLSGTTAPVGYHAVSSSGQTVLYENPAVLPVGYATSSLMNEEYFDTLSYPANAEAFTKFCVVPAQGTTSFSSAVKPYSGTAEIAGYQNLNWTKSNGIYHVSAQKDAHMNISLSKPLNGEILFVRFRMLRREEWNSAWISINGVKNKLSSKTAPYPNGNDVFDFAISSNEVLDKLEIDFSADEFEITDISLKTLDYSTITAATQQVDAMEFDDATSSDRISGSIHVRQDGYFVLSVPYDEGFHITVNGDNVSYEKVNKAFIGFPVTAGEKHIEITYRAPWQNAGLFASGAGVLCFAAILFWERLHRRKKP